MWRLSAATTATASPTKRARSAARSEKFRPRSAAWGGTIGSGRAASPRSAAVTTHATPGNASAREASMAPMRAWACGLLRMTACSMPGSAMSPTKRPRPWTRRGSSLRRSRSPMNFTGSLDLAQARVIEHRDGDAPRRHPLADLSQEFGEDAHLVLGRVAAQARFARDAIGIDFRRRGAAALDREPEVAVAAELDILDHRGDGGLDVAHGVR